MFRCCIPCRGGSKAPATSSPDSETSPCDPLYPCETIVHDGHKQPQTILSNSKQSGRYDIEHGIDVELEHTNNLDQQYLHEQIQALHYSSIQHQQQSLLPHIEEEEESSQISPEDEVCIVYSMLVCECIFFCSLCSILLFMSFCFG